MNLTLIKGRGKGPRKAGFRQPNPKRRKLATEDGDASAPVRKQNSAAPIEKLPTELLHRILLFSREYNFPKASLRIGKLLSHPSFFTELVLQAFEPTWDTWMGCTKGRVYSYHGWFEDGARFGGDPELQSKVLELRFVTIDTVLNAQQMWARKNGADRYYEHTRHSDYSVRDYDPYRRSDDEDGVRHRLRGYGHMESAADCFEEEWVYNCFDSCLTFNPRLEVHPSIRIPDRLITGPFEKKDAKLLSWLVYNNAVLAEDQSWDMILQGVNNLFHQDDAEVANVVTTLFYFLGGFKDLPKGVAPLSLATACHKLARHRRDGQPCHEHCTWKSVVNRLFNLVDRHVDLGLEYTGQYGLYVPERSPWRDYGGLIDDPDDPGELVTWER